MEIAVFAGQDNKTASWGEAGEIRIYQYHCGIWQVNRSMAFDLSTASCLPQMREYMDAAVEFMGECRTFAGRSVTGLPYYELEKAGVTIWEFDENAEDVPEKIRMTEMLELPRIEMTQTISSPELVQVSPNIYSISLQEIQNCSHLVTSKQVLMPILKDMNFDTLEIICSHVPPWLETQIITGELNAEIISIDSQKKLVYVHRTYHTLKQFGDNVCPDN